LGVIVEVSYQTGGASIAIEAMGILAMICKDVIGRTGLPCLC
jgi:hypothetical protein